MPASVNVEDTQGQPPIISRNDDYIGWRVFDCPSILVELRFTGQSGPFVVPGSIALRLRTSSDHQSRVFGFGNLADEDQAHFNSPSWFSPPSGMKGQLRHLVRRRLFGASPTSQGRTALPYALR